MDRDTKSIFITDERAVSSLIGFILLFAIGIIAFSSYQAFVVPNQNAQVEFSHSQQIENEFSDFRSNVVNAIESTDERSTSFTLGTQYPSRLIALNPPAAAGTLSTTEPGEVSLDSEAVGIGDVCGVNDATSRSLVYEPQYNEYQSAQSTVYENTFVGTTFRDGQSFPQPQRMIREDGVYLTLLTGSVSESRTGAIGVNINATERYHHEDEIDGLTIPSQFDSETWESQILADNEKVQRVDPAGDGRVEIILDEPFDVSCAVIGLNSDPEFTPPQTEPEPADPTFDTLEAEVTDTGGQGQINEIELDYQIDPNEEETIDFRVYNDEGRTDLIDTIQRQSAGEEFTWDVNRRGQDPVPVYIEADIDGGECLTAELEQEGDPAVLNTGDWEDC